jgi:hypothetical protein
VSNIPVTRNSPIRVAIFLVACFSIGWASPKSEEPRLPCNMSPRIGEKDNTPIWFASEEMKRRATEKTDVGGVLKNADVNANVIASVMVGTNGDVECVKVINPKHPMVVNEVYKALRQWKFQTMKQNGKPVDTLDGCNSSFAESDAPKAKAKSHFSISSR